MDCKSVGNPGYGCVIKFIEFNLFLQLTSSEFGSISLIFAPIFKSLSVKKVKCAGKTSRIIALPRVAIIAVIKVPASILSGIVVYSIG